MSRWSVIHGDSADVLARFPENSVDALVTDPPGWIDFMSKKWDSSKDYPEFLKVMEQCYRVLKPGAHGLIWGIPRTSWLTASGAHAAGFFIRDKVHHIFGSGMPHAKDASKAIDIELLGGGTVGAAKANELRPVVGTYRVGGNAGTTTAAKGGTYGVGVPNSDPKMLKRTTGYTPEAQAFDGWLTNLKPGCEDWYLVQKPYPGTLAENLLKWGTGALNIDATRIARDWSKRGESWARSGKTKKPKADKIAAPPGQGMILHPLGSWTPNIVFTHSEACDPTSGTCVEGCPARALPPDAIEHGYFHIWYANKTPTAEREAGCEALPLSSAHDNVGRKEGQAGVDRPQAGAGRTGGRHNNHVTVKCRSFMEFAVRLVGVPRGLVVDPYCGSGSTGTVAVPLGMDFIGIERSPCEIDPTNAVEIARARVAHWAARGAR